MHISDLQLLPRFSDGLTFLYVEHARVEQDAQAIVLVDLRGRVPVPAAALGALLLGPGTSVTHAAMTACAANGCSVVFCGEGGVRLYAAGLGDTRSAENLLAQARLWADPEEHLRVVVRLYRMRFDEVIPENFTLEQLRGREGVRVRETYARMSRETGVRWTGRAYRQSDWSSADPVNRALSTANACLYGLCHAAIVSTGFSPALGFIHTGKSLAFVYDIADLYKCELTIPVAFAASQEGPLTGLEARVRRRCRDEFRRTKLLERIVPDIQRALALRPESVKLIDGAELDAVGDLWGPSGSTAGGQNHGVSTEEEPDDSADTEVPF